MRDLGSTRGHVRGAVLRNRRYRPRPRLIGQEEGEVPLVSGDTDAWDRFRGFLALLTTVLTAVAALIIALWIWWLIFYINQYHSLRDDICDIKEQCCGEYNATEELCFDLGNYTTIGCIGNVDEDGRDDFHILSYNASTENWESKPVDEACPALCANGTDGADGDPGINCWDINGNGLCDLSPEDINNDGVCNQTDCLGAAGADGMDGANATIDECDKPFGQLYYANGTTPDDATPFVLTFGAADTWTAPTGIECAVSTENFIDAVETGCEFNVTVADSYKIQLDMSFETTMPPGTEIWVGISINGVDPELQNAFSVHSADQDTLSFTLALFLNVSDIVSFQLYSKNTTGSLDIDRVQFTAVGELLCGFDVTGPQGPQGVAGPAGDDGINCWDLNENGFCDLGTEDINTDGVCDVDDCTLANISYDNITGDICPVLDAVSIDCLGDVNVTSPTDDQILVYQSGQWVNEDPESVDYSCVFEEPCDCGTVDCPAGTRWFNSEQGVEYYCDCADNSTRWLHVGPPIQAEGENDDVCLGFSDIDGPGNVLDEGCHVHWGSGLGANPAPDPTNGLYFPYDFTVVATGLTVGDPSCIGNLTTSICWTIDNTMDDTFDLGNCTSLGLTTAGLSNDAIAAKGLRIDVPGDRYILWGINNICSGNVGQWNLVFYYKMRYDPV